MTYTLFFIPGYQFHKVFFYVFLGNNFLTVFCGGPGQLPSLPSLKSGPAVVSGAARIL